MIERSALYEDRYITKTSCQDYRAKSDEDDVTVINIALARVYAQVLGLMRNYT